MLDGRTHAEVASLVGVSRRRVSQIIAGSDPPRKIWASFEDARAYARSLHLRHRRDWIDHCRDGSDEKKRADVPSAPHLKYRGEFINYADFLGLKVEPRRPFLPFAEQREYIRAKELGSYRAWIGHKRAFKKVLLQRGIMLKPERHPEFLSWRDFLGLSNWCPAPTVPIAPEDHPWRKYPIKFGRGYDRYVGPVLINSRTERAL